MKTLLTKEEYFELKKNPIEFNKFLEQFAHLPRKSREEEIQDLQELDEYLVRSRKERINIENNQVNQ